MWNTTCTYQYRLDFISVGRNSIFDLVWVIIPLCSEYGDDAREKAICLRQPSGKKAPAKGGQGRAPVASKGLNRRSSRCGNCNTYIFIDIYQLLFITCRKENNDVFDELTAALEACLDCEGLDFTAEHDAEVALRKAGRRV